MLSNVIEFFTTNVLLGVVIVIIAGFIHSLTIDYCKFKMDKNKPKSELAATTNTPQEEKFIDGEQFLYILFLTGSIFCLYLPMMLLTFYVLNDAGLVEIVVKRIQDGAFPKTKVTFSPMLLYGLGPFYFWLIKKIIKAGRSKQSTEVEALEGKVKYKNIIVVFEIMYNKVQDFKERRQKKGSSEEKSEDKEV
ncbi:hypothetical protein [Solibacillus sp. NPDC093137]|uniref:hypothetical protein n=1 Tax=Solibacillus sp. NPDC093137 TaxID=3390678 RepID=UPI003D05EC40